MATTGQLTAPIAAIAAFLGSDGRGLSFFQAVRLLRACCGADMGMPMRSGCPRIEVRPDLSLSFPARDVLAVESLADGSGFRLTVSFMGLYGVASPLPLFYTERLIDLERNDHSAARGFVDVLHQMLYPLLFSAWARCRPWLEALEGSDQGTLARMRALVGMWDAELGRQAPEGLPILRYAGLLSLASRPLLGLETLLRDLLGDRARAVRVGQAWGKHAIPRAQQLRLGGGGRARLGCDMLLGRHGPGGTAEVSVLIESVVADQFLALLPDGEWHARVVFVLRLYLGMRLPWYVEVACRSGDQGRLCLGGKAWCRLGWDAWLSNSAGGERCVRVAASN